MRTQSYIFAGLILLLVAAGCSYALMSPSEIMTPVIETPTPTTSAETTPSSPSPVSPAAPTEAPASSTSTGSMITVDTPTPNSKIASPLSITGSARGPWYFEASFPIQLVDANGNVLAQTHGQAQGDWMTENFVPFTATVTWATSTTATGTLILMRDNPSGMPEHDAQIEIPVTF